MCSLHYYLQCTFPVLQPFSYVTSFHVAKINKKHRREQTPLSLPQTVDMSTSTADSTHVYLYRSEQTPCLYRREQTRLLLPQRVDTPATTADNRHAFFTADSRPACLIYRRQQTFIQQTKHFVSVYNTARSEMRRIDTYTAIIMCVRLSCKHACVRVQFIYA